MTRAVASLLVATLSGLAAAGCGADPHGLDWGFEFATPALRARATVIEARILRGGCTGAAIYTTEIPVGAVMSVAADRPGELGAGRYGLSGSARDAACTIVAEGCVEVDLPVDADMRHVVTLNGATERPACAAVACTNGSCRPADAGPPDAGPIDAATGADAGPGMDSGGIDSGTLDDAGYDAGPSPPDAGPPPPVDAGPPLPDAGSTCVAGTADCNMDGTCETSTATDRANCGACARPCGTAAACVGAMCTCTSPLVSDGTRGCIDPRYDPSACGAARTVCADSKVCVMGTCVCRPGLEAIGGGGCTDLQTDPDNCGVIGRDCSTMGSMVTCRGGTCQDACTAGQMNCSNACVVLSSDPMHCGTCLNVCNQDQMCVSGRCMDYGPGLGCTMCPCATGCDPGTPTCCSILTVPFCVEGSTCPTFMP